MLLCFRKFTMIIKEQTKIIKFIYNIQYLIVIQPYILSLWFAFISKHFNFLFVDVLTFRFHAAEYSLCVFNICCKPSWLSEKEPYHLRTLIKINLLPVCLVKDSYLLQN